MSLAKWIVTFGGVGLLRPMPGTWGSLATLPFVWLIFWTADGNGLLAMGMLAFATALSAAVGWWATERYLAESGGKDPSEVVIDEVAGQFLTFLVAAPFMAVFSLDIFIAAFVLFRIFDIIKLGPAKWADRDLAGAAGVMVDDLVAGCYAGVILIIINRLL